MRNSFSFQKQGKVDLLHKKQRFHLKQYFHAFLTTIQHFKHIFVYNTKSTGKGKY